MASVAKKPNGTRDLLFKGSDGRRRKISLGKATAKQADAFRLRVAQLLQDQRMGTPHDAALSQWLVDLPPLMRRKLVRAGLQDEAPAALTMEGLIEKFTNTRTVKPATMAIYRQATDSLTSFFGAGRRIDTITPADAEGWQAHIAKEGRVREKKGPRNLSRATVAKRTNVVKAIFNRAVRWKLLASSPFGDLKPGSQVNPARSRYITVEEADKIIAGCPSAEWRALVGIARYAGLRCPSEPRELRWTDIDWSNRSMTVRSPKTEGHASAVRTVPVAPALQPLLWQLRQEASPGAVYVFPILQPKHFSPRTMLKRVIGRVGVSIADKPFQNMRASCETDWSAQYPTHEFAKWMGHSPAVAAKHYLQSREVHFRSATGSEPWATGCVPEGAKSVAPRVQNRLQLASAVDGTGSAYEHATPETQRGCTNVSESVQPRAVSSDGRYWIRTSDPTRVMRVL